LVFIEAYVMYGTALVDAVKVPSRVSGERIPRLRNLATATLPRINDVVIILAGTWKYAHISVGVAHKGWSKVKSKSDFARISW
jgi:hypothetical protein